MTAMPPPPPLESKSYGKQLLCPLFSCSCYGHARSGGGTVRPQFSTSCGPGYMLPEALWAQGPIPSHGAGGA